VVRRAFAAGATTRSITIEVKSDTKKEATEYFYRDLFGNSSNESFRPQSIAAHPRGCGTLPGGLSGRPSPGASLNTGSVVIQDRAGAAAPGEQRVAAVAERLVMAASPGDSDGIGRVSGPQVREQVGEVGTRGAGRQRRQDVPQVRPRVEPMSPDGSGDAQQHGRGP
jgi:hypothetical protein